MTLKRYLIGYEYNYTILKATGLSMPHIMKILLKTLLQN